MAKAKISKKLADEIIRELVGEEALAIIEFLKKNKHASEFKIAEMLKQEIHFTRNILYRLLEHNLVTFIRKKDKIKGWYICYWDYNDEAIPHLSDKLKKMKLVKLEERLAKEHNNFFFMCKNACTRMNFDRAAEFNFKCPECGQLMNEQNNEKTVEFLQKNIEDLKKEIEKSKT
jgi:transcription initiation factor TFIIE subunit alpha